MYRTKAFKLLGVVAAVVLMLSQFTTAFASHIDFGGEAEDHYWSLLEITQFCKDGFTINAQEGPNPLTYSPRNPTTVYYNGDTLPFSVQLSASTVPVSQPMPARIAGGVGGGPDRALVSGQATFLFAQPQAIGTPIMVTVERWDHGASSIVETDPDVSDISGFDESKPLSGSVEDCKVDTTAPTISISSPQGQDYAHTASVTTSWVSTDALSGIATNSGKLDGNTVSNGQAVDLFSLSLGQHTLVVKAADKSGNSAQASVTFNVVATIDSLMAATQRAYSAGGISKPGIYASLGTKLQSAQTALQSGDLSTARASLNAYLNELAAQRGKAISQLAYNLLSTDANYVLQHLPSA